MTDRPILYSAPMVRAILDDRKTKTRRVIVETTQPENVYVSDFDAVESKIEIENRKSGQRYWKQCPYGQIGDRLWVRETWQVVRERLDYETGGEFDVCDWTDSIEAARKYLHGNARFGLKTGLYYAADGEDVNPCNFYDTVGFDGKVLSPREMVWRPSIHMPRWASRITLEITNVRVERLQDISRGDAMDEGCPFPNLAKQTNPVGWFGDLWRTIYGPASWDANPWVWVIEFKRVAG